MKLISMTDFVLSPELQYEEPSPMGFSIRVNRYANFLIQLLKLWMFVPCKEVDGKWVVLEEPNDYENFPRYKTNIMPDHKIEWYIECLEYQQAKERCLFEGLEYEGVIVKKLYGISKVDLFKDRMKDCKTVEGLLIMTEKYILSPTAQKQLGL